MKIRSIIRYTATIAALTGMPFLAQRVQATPPPVLGQISFQFGTQHTQYQPSWNDDQKRELRHIYYRLEHANRDYDGYRGDAVREIRRAAEEMGMDLHGAGYALRWQGSSEYGGYGQQPETQEWSDSILRRCHDRLKDLAKSADEPVRHHLFDAVHQLDMALQAR